VAGLTAAAVVVPQAMAYADIAGLPLAVGLYTALVPLVVYAVMGTSRPLSVTTTSMIAILTAGITPSSLAGLNRMGIELVGEVRGGLPSFELPDTSVLPHLLPAASGIALMSFVETAAAGKAFRNADEPRPEANRELFAVGLTNLVVGFFQNMRSGGGTSQTAVNRSAGARSQIAGLVTAATVMAVLLFLAPREHPEDEIFPGLLLLKTEGVIHFANVQRIGDLMSQLVEEHKPQAVVIDCSAIPDFE
jgi:MFS superfamily sulfate permease-like transporter